jgi:hypothetical protein
METEEDIGVKQQQTKDCWQPPGFRRVKKWILSSRDSLKKRFSPLENSALLMSWFQLGDSDFKYMVSIT